MISRISLTVHSLRAALEHPQLAGSILEVAPLGNALSAALGQLATRALTRARQTGNGGSATSLGASPSAAADQALPPLRRLHHELVAELSGREELAPLLAQLDELVDATDTLGAILGARPPSATLAVG